MNDESLTVRITTHPSNATLAFQPGSLTDHHVSILDNLMVAFALMHCGNLDNAQKVVSALANTCENCLSSMLLAWAFHLGENAGEEVIGETLKVMRAQIAVRADLNDHPDGLSSPFSD